MSDDTQCEAMFSYDAATENQKTIPVDVAEDEWNRTEREGRAAAARAQAWATNAPDAPYGGFKMSKQALDHAAQKEVAKLTVAALYATFDVELLKQVLAIALQYEGKDRHAEVALMNETLAELIERREAEQ